VSKAQYLRVISIGAALLVGFWLPLRLIHYKLPVSLDILLDLLISAASAVNIYLFFHSDDRSWKQRRDWVSLGLLADLACLMPLSLLEILIFQTKHESLLLLNLLTVRHIWRIKSFLDEFHSLQPVVYRLVPIVMTMPLLVHLIACAWIALGSGTAGPDPDQILEYVKAIYWAFTTLTTVGYGDISAKTPGQMLFACGVQVVGVGVFGFVLSNVASLLSRVDAAREHHMDSLDKIETFMRSNHIPQDMRLKVRTYYHYLWKNHRGYQDHSLLDELPAKMQSELYFYINRTIIEKVPIFRHAGQELLEDLMNELEPRIFSPGEKIFRAGDIGDALYFIHNGRVEIVGEANKLIAQLEDGACFGEMALVSDKPRSASARASSFCHVYVLSKDSFNRVVEAYPEFRGHLEEMAVNRQAPRAS
jgi:hypothetical protein